MPRLTPLPPMMATPARTLPTGRDWSYEIKWDGYRAMLLKDSAGARLVSRNLKDLTRAYPHIAAAAGQVSSDAMMLDGEVVALGEDGRPAFQALQHRSVKRSAVVFYAFDLLHLAGDDLRRMPLRDRRRALHQLRFGAPILLSSPLPGTARQIERVVADAGLEGVVAKRVNSIYEPGRRSPAWLKVRFSKRQEFVVGGFKPLGATFDSVLVGYFEGPQLYYAGKVRAGFTPRTRDELLARLSRDIVDKCPFVNLPNSVGKTHWGEGITAEEMTALGWLTPRVVIEVAFTEWTAGGNLRHAAFVGMREDKPAREVGRR